MWFDQVLWVEWLRHERHVPTLFSKFSVESASYQRLSHLANSLEDLTVGRKPMVGVQRSPGEIRLIFQCFNGLTQQRCRRGIGIVQCCSIRGWYDARKGFSQDAMAVLVVAELLYGQAHGGFPS